MATLKEKLTEIIPGLRNDVKSLIKEHGSKQISEVSVAQAYGGMRGVKGLVSDTSLVDPEEGLIIRGIPVRELTESGLAERGFERGQIQGGFAIEGKEYFEPTLEELMEECGGNGY